MQRPQSESSEGLGTATVYLSMDELMKPEGGAAGVTLSSSAPAIDIGKTYVGLGPGADAPIVRTPRPSLPALEAPRPGGAPSPKAKPGTAPSPERAGPGARLAARLRLEWRVWSVCCRLFAAGRYSLRTLAGSRRWALVGLMGVAALGVLGLWQLGGSSVEAHASSLAVPPSGVPSVAPDPVSPAPEVVPVVSTEAPLAEPLEAALSDALPPGTTLERAAADALAAARYAVALERYRALVRERPDDAALAAMVAALERREAADAFTGARAR